MNGRFFLKRQRIAWELHDSAKQRVHAAHLMLSALDRAVADPQARGLLDGALAELRNATADMETSVDELRTPLDGRPVDEQRQFTGILRPREYHVVPGVVVEAGPGVDGGVRITGASPYLARRVQ